MKKRLHDKKAGIAILLSLIVLSLAELIFRALVIKEAVLTTANVGEQITVIALAVTILVLTAKGKDRLCYLCYGAWASYFVLDQLFELPGVIAEMTALASQEQGSLLIPIAVAVVRILSMCGIVAIGIILVEYMNDGTICNRAFNSVCIATILLLFVNIISSSLGAIFTEAPIMWLETFHGVYRITMVCMFTFFAYDSAKAQLKKTDLTK